MDKVGNPSDQSVSHSADHTSCMQYDTGFASERANDPHPLPTTKSGVIGKFRLLPRPPSGTFGFLPKVVGPGHLRSVAIGNAACSLLEPAHRVRFIAGLAASASHVELCRAAATWQCNAPRFLLRLPERVFHDALVVDRHEVDTF